MSDLEDRFKPNPISEVLQSLVHRKGWQDQYYQAKLDNKWAEIVGEKIAHETAVDSLKEGILTIRTTTSTWRTELTMRAEQLIEKINEELRTDVVEKIVIR